MKPGTYAIMRDFTTIFLILVSACRTLEAAPRVFQDHNFAMELPTNWQTLDPSPAQALALSQSSNGMKLILVIARKLPANELSSAASDMSAGARQSAIDKGLQIMNEHDISLSGVPFHVIMTRAAASASIVTFVGVAGDEGYMLQGICKTGDASSDPEVQASVNSFRLLSPRSIPLEKGDPDSIAYRVGYVFGKLLVIAILGAGFVWLVRKMKKPRVR
jgi:hypothetical protein